MKMIPITKSTGMKVLINIVIEEKKLIIQSNMFFMLEIKNKQKKQIIVVKNFKKRI
jgi:hypothetical protein